MIELSLVIPCYNEAPALKELITRVNAALEASELASSQFELVLVDNGSRDGSWEVMEQLKAETTFSFMRPLRVDVNEGYGHGMAEGLRAARGRTVATSHADLQCDPVDVFRGYQRWVELERDPGRGPVMVKGVRSGRPLPARVVSRLFDAASLLILQRWLYETNAQPKVFSANLLADRLSDAPKDFCFDLYLVLQALSAGYGLETIHVRFPPRPYGESHWAASFSGRWRTFARFLRYMANYRV